MVGLAGTFPLLFAMAASACSSTAEPQRHRCIDAAPDGFAAAEGAAWCVTGLFQESAPPDAEFGTLLRRRLPTGSETSIRWERQAISGMPLTFPTHSTVGAWTLAYGDEEAFLIEGTTVVASRASTLRRAALVAAGGELHVASMGSSPAGPYALGLYVWRLCNRTFGKGPGCDAKYVPTPGELPLTANHRIVAVGSTVVLQRDKGFNGSQGQQSEILTVSLDGWDGESELYPKFLDLTSGYACGTAAVAPPVGNLPALLWFPMCEPSQLWRASPYVAELTMAGPSATPTKLGDWPSGELSQEIVQAADDGSVFVAKGPFPRTVTRLERRALLEP